MRDCQTSLLALTLDLQAWFLLLEQLHIFRISLLLSSSYKSSSFISFKSSSFWPGLQASSIAFAWYQVFVPDCRTLNLQIVSDLLDWIELYQILWNPSLHFLALMTFKLCNFFLDLPWTCSTCSMFFFFFQPYSFYIMNRCNFWYELIPIFGDNNCSCFKTSTDISHVFLH